MQKSNFLYGFLQKNLHNSKKKCNFATQNAFLVKKSILFILFSLFVSTLSAQTSTSYYCDFEDAAENAQWHLNYSPNPDFNLGATSKNQWYMGAAGSFGVASTQGLYIADTTRSTVCGYTATNFSGFQVAYRDMTLKRGSYTIQFDWKALGQTNDELIVLWVPTSQVVACAHNTTDQPLPDDWAGWNKAIHLRGRANWQSYTGSLDVTSNGGKLVVMWYNKKGVATNPGGAIDNIRIYQGQSCAAPYNVSYAAQTMTLSWNGNDPTAQYDVLVYNYQTQNTTTFTNLSGRSIKLSSFTDEGTFYFYVRSNCGDSLHTSNWVYTSSFVYIPGKRCVEYLSFGTDRTKSAGVCYIGSHSSSSSHSTLSFGASPAMLDNGPNDPTSMHTLHTDISETDPNTENKLKTVPDDEIASVRLGSSEYGGDDARIEYKYRVQAGQSDLLELNYACVLQSGGHSADNPFFQLEILDRNGHQIEGCTHEYFVADMTGVGGKWHQNGDIWWSNWDKVTVSLRDFLGQTLTIRLTTSRCVYDTHFGYAYFTIGCRGGGLEGISCGDYSTDHFDAPEGFYYRWYWEGEPNRILSTDSHFDITSTTDSIYVCDVISKTATDCYYKLTANPNPRFPKAQANILDQTPRNCENRAKILNKARVYYVDRKTGDPMQGQHSEQVETVYWNWGDGSPMEENNDSIVEHVFPESGGVFQVMMIASMSEGTCVDTGYVEVSLPNIKTDPTSEEINVCRAETPTYRLPNGSIVSSDTTFSTFSRNKYGCDAEVVHYLFFRDSALSVKDTTFCEGGYIDFEGKRYTETGTYKVPLKTIYGCDSTMSLNLTVIPSLEIDVAPTFRVCGDGVLDIPFDIIKGRYSGVKVHLGDSVYSFGVNDPVSIPMYNELTDSYLRPDLYDVVLELGTPDCPAEPVHVKAEINYASFIMYQKHGFIGLYNSDFNTYGFEFEKKYTWYCNDELMPNDTLAYIRVKDSDWGKKYRVDVIRRDDGKVMSSCPLTYTYGMPQGVEDLVADDEVVAYFDILGRRYATLPKQKGVYVVVYGKHAEKVVVE